MNTHRFNHDVGHSVKTEASRKQRVAESTGVERRLFVGRQQGVPGALGFELLDGRVGGGLQHSGEVTPLGVDEDTAANAANGRTGLQGLRQLRPNVHARVLRLPRIRIYTSI